MKPQNKRLFVVTVIAVFVGAILGVIGYYFVSHLYSKPAPLAIQSNTYIPPVSTTSSIIISNSSASTLAISSVTSALLPVPIDVSNWKTYMNYELGFSFQYPPDLISDASNPSAVILTFPTSYFSGTTTESETFSVAISPTCSQTQSESTNISGVTFSEDSVENTTGSNYDNSTVYEGYNNSVCYTIKEESEGPVNMANNNDTANIDAIVNSILSTFTFINTPPGENEADYSAQQNENSNQGQVNSATTPSLINLTNVSSSTVSVGGNIILTGSGFSGNNTIVLISNGSVQGVLRGGFQSSDTSISVTLPAQVCTQYIDVSSTTSCPSYLILNSGVYTLSVSNQNGTTEPVYIRIP